MNTIALAITVAGLVGLIFALEQLYFTRQGARPGGAGAGGEAVYLVSRVAARHGFQLCEKPLSLTVPAAEVTHGDVATLHYHLPRRGRDLDSITLKAVHGCPSRLGSVVIDNDPTRVVAAGLKRLPFYVPELDRSFQVFTEADRQVVVDNLLTLNGELVRLLRDLACLSRRGHFELVDLGGTVKIQFEDRNIRFPSDVEKISLDLVRLHELYEDMAGPRPATATGPLH